LTPIAPKRNAIDPVTDFSIQADSGELPRVSAWLREAGPARGMPAEPLWRLDLCVTEAIANVIDHGGAGARSSPIGLRLAVRREASGGEAAITVSDGGAAFDPRAAAPKPRAHSLAEAEPGGKGLILLHKFADTLEYTYREARNHLTIHVRWKEEGAWR
jgi:anti-sigma regulatory factor (Ser/Thr protein kinase)